MSITQGFKIVDDNVYVYQENTTSDAISAAFGLDVSGTGVWFLNLSTSAGAKPGVGFQPIAIDASTGVITFTPLGGGYVLVDGPLQVTGSTSFSGDLVTINSAASATANSVRMEKNRSGGVITSGDALGQVYFQGHDGTQYVTGASITSTTSGTIAANRVASNLVFATHPDSASGLTPTTRMTIAPTGSIVVAAPDSGVALTITAGGLTVTAGATTLSALNSRGVVQTNASGVLSTSAGTNGQILISDTATGTPTWATITAGSGIAITNGANSISIATTGGTTWNEVVGASDTMVVDNGYIANNAGVVTLTLPAVAVVGDTVEVTGKGAGGWLIAQNAGQTIYFGTSTTTPGVGGSLASTAQRDSIKLVCVTANDDWNVLSSIGTITVV